MTREEINRIADKVRGAVAELLDADESGELRNESIGRIAKACEVEAVAAMEELHFTSENP